MQLVVSIRAVALLDHRGIKEKICHLKITQNGGSCISHFPYW